MRRTIKKEINLNRLKTGCSPCMTEAKKMEQRISKRKISKIKIDEVKTIVSSMFKKNWSLTSISLALNAAKYIFYTQAALARELYMRTKLIYDKI